MNNEEIISRTLFYIENNLHKKITLEELSTLSFFSKAHLYRIFNELVGSSVMEYIRKRRLLSASSDLCNTNDTILNIAIKYQFDSQDGFCRAFKKSFGLTPMQYRKINKKNNLREDLFMNNSDNKTVFHITNQSPNENHILNKNYIDSIKDREAFSSQTMILEKSVITLDDLSIQKILRQIDIIELIAAMKGASGNVQIRIFKNLSKRVTDFITDELINFDENNIDEIVNAQNKILEKIKKL